MVIEVPPARGPLVERLGAAVDPAGDLRDSASARVAVEGRGGPRLLRQAKDDEAPGRRASAVPVESFDQHRQAEGRGDEKRQNHPGGHPNGFRARDEG